MRKLFVDDSDDSDDDDAMANVVCEYANDTSSPIRDGSVNLDDSHSMPDFSNRSTSPSAKRFASDGNGSNEPGRRIRRSESLLRQAADSVSRGQTFQTVSDMFQIPISTIRYATNCSSALIFPQLCPFIAKN